MKKVPAELSYYREQNKSYAKSQQASIDPALILIKCFS